jgi:uncharacterized protein (TIGR02246 family)
LGVNRVPDNRHKENNMSAGTILKQFYDAVQRRDMAKARTHLDDNMTFVGLFETYPNADAYIATFTQLMQIVARLEVKIIIGEGDNAAIFMEMVTTAPAPATTLVAEWHQTRNGRIVHAQSAFDGRPFAAMFAGNHNVDADERAIRALKDTFGKALLNRDAKLRASIWTEDGSVVPPQGGYFRGRGEMARHFETEGPSVTRDSGVTFTDYRFRFINRDTAFVDTALELSNVFGPDGKVHDLVPITVTFTAVRQGGRWLIQDERAHFRAGN